MDTVSFILSKLLWIAASPGNLLLLLLIVGTVLLFTRRRRSGRAVVVVVAGILALAALLPVGEWLLRPLEGRFPRPAQLPEKVDGILLLGGSVAPPIAAYRQDVAVGDAAERLSAFVELARAYPDAMLVYTGGSGSVRFPELLEPPVVQAWFRQVGFDPERVVYESASRNTYENAVLTKRLVDPRPGQTWLLVTSAAHMPRSVGIFRRAGWPVVPVPTDYRTGPLTLNPARIDMAGNLDQFNAAWREWLGLVAYRAMGRTDALFPRPD